MVISCPECSTRFRVDESKIPERGAKIRCARCKHIFAVAPPAPAPEPVVEEPIQPPTEPASVAAPPAVDAPTSAPADKDFGYPEIGSGSNDEIDPSAFDDDGVEEEDFSFGEEYGNVDLDGGTDNDEAEEPFSFGEPAPAAPPAEPATEHEQFSFSPAPRKETDQTDSSAASDIKDSPLDDISMPPRDDGFNLNEEESALPALTKKATRGPLSVVILFVLMLTLAILIAGGFLMWKNGLTGVEQILTNLTGLGQQTELKGDIRLENLQGSFITNRKEGELFVIQGIAINNFAEAQAAIQVKGMIFDKTGKQLMQKTIFCGNPINDNDLRKMPYSRMEELMGNQFGESLANLNVTSGQSIPFTIVFRKLPKTLSEFVVELADSKPAAQ
ncbi:MAG: zinc-ribbon domain-containing protein [Geopsychrobacter sp.]|nr:zinc-ribbon domain-containing protein [Geopsychrobacter sp.]